MEDKLPSASNLSYLPALTGIRAIAAYMVYCVHFDPFEQYHFYSTGIGHFFYVFFQEFGIGVTIFFVLSGFLITLRYAGTIKLEREWFITYIINRVARIYPMYFLITALTFIIYSYDISYDYMGQYRQFNSTERAVTQFLNFSLLRGFSDNFKFTGIAQGWSLTVEECFYILSPILLIGIGIRYRRIFIYPLLLLTLGVVLTLVCSKLNIFGVFSNFSFLFSYTFFGRCIEFFMGMALALYLKYNTPKVFGRSSKYTSLGIAGILISIVLLSLNDIYIESTITRIIINNILLPIPICLLYIGLIFEDNLTIKMLKSRFFDLLGKSSYTFYLIHMGVFQIFIHRHITTNSLVLFLLLNTVAILLYKIIEGPCHRWIKSFSKRLFKTRLAAG